MNNNQEQTTQTINQADQDINSIKTEEQEKAWDRFIRNTAIFLSSAES